MQSDVDAELARAERHEHNVDRATRLVVRHTVRRVRSSFMPCH